MIKVSASVVSKGIGISKVLVYKSALTEVVYEKINKKDIVKELMRFELAITNVGSILEKIKRKVKDKEQKEIIEAQIYMAFDPEFKAKVQEHIKNKENVKWAIESVIKENIELLEEMGIQDRIDDFLDIKKRFFLVLGEEKQGLNTRFDEKMIIAAKNLLPSELLSLDIKNITAIILQRGGSRTSHLAILAKSLSIPMLIGVKNLNLQDNQRVIVDALNGFLIIEPDDQTLLEYERKKEEYNLFLNKIKTLEGEDSKSKDGKKIGLYANIDTLDDIDRLKDYKVDGVGLFRSEFLFLEEEIEDDEEGQFKIYKQVLQKCSGPVTIRTIDLGADKLPNRFNEISEDNPALGLRAIRFCLEYKDIFLTQLRALFRASIFGNLKIMIPLISSLSEVEQTLEIIEDVKKDLRKEKIKFSKDVKIGIMIEVPSAAIISDILATKVDFFSIGTNDLIQYTLAADRLNDKISYLYKPFNLAVLKLIALIIDNARKANIEVSMCGEMANDPSSLLLLLAFNLRNFSMNLKSLSQIKYLIKNVDLRELKGLKKKILSFTSEKEVNNFLKEWMNERFDYSL